MNFAAINGRVVASAVALAAVAALASCGTAAGGGDGRHGSRPSAGGSTAASATAGPGEVTPSRIHKASGRCGVDRLLVPRCGAWWGIYSLQGRTPTSSVTDLEKQVGRRFDIVLRFHDWSTGPGPGRFPDASERALGRSRMLFFAWESKLYQKKQAYKWRDIAAGTYDKSVIRPVAERVRAYGKKVFMSFDPEMDRHITKGDLKGTEAEYVAAARHVHHVFQHLGVKNVIWVWVVTGTMGGDNPQRMLNSYPGDAYVDWVGWDPYNFYACHRTTWHTFDEKVGPTYRFLVSKGFARKPFILPEYGTQYDPANPGRAKEWYAPIPTVLKQKYPNIAGLIRFDAGEGCGLQIDSGAGMLASYAAAGKNPYLNPPGR